jgi:hypothetical protein
MQLLPAMIDVQDPGACEADVVADVRCREMAAIARHELDEEVAVKPGSVYCVGQRATGVDADVEIAILLVADRRYGPRHRPVCG